MNGDHLTREMTHAEMKATLESFIAGYAAEQDEAQRLIVASEDWANEIVPVLFSYGGIVTKDSIPACRILRRLIERIWYMGYQAGQRSTRVRPLAFCITDPNEKEATKDPKAQ